MATISILGIDPGSRFTGYGVIRASAQKTALVTCGVVRVDTVTVSLGEKLWQIYQSLDDIIKEHKPDVAAIESVFMAKNASSALKLGQARGAAMVAAAAHGLAIHEYSPREVKLAVTGSGGADKNQVDKMVRLLLSIDSRERLRSDATDALAVAICYANTKGAIAHLVRQ